MNLQELEFIYEKCIFPELEYMFKHALTREVAYASLLIKKRKELHAQVGQAIDTMSQCAMDISVTCWSAGDYRKLADISGRAIDLLEDSTRAKDIFMGGINVYSQLC